MTWCPDAPSWVVPPAGWGSALARRYDPANGRQVIVPCRRLVVHHSASNQPAPGGEPAFSRQIESYGESRDGAGVEYSYLVYPTGVVHGGFGDTRGCHAAQNDPSGQSYNVTSVGVCLVGYFHPPQNHQVTPAAVDALQRLVGWLVDSGRLSSEVRTKAPRNGSPGWYGHRDVWATACPGDSLYPRLGDILAASPSTPPPPPTEDDMAADRRIRFRGYHNQFLAGSGALQPIAPEYAGELESVPLVVCDWHPQTVGAIEHQWGPQEWVPTGERV